MSKENKYCTMQKYNIRSSYNSDYKKEIENPVDIKVFVAICNGYMKFLVNKLLVKGEIMLPLKIGNILILGHKSNIRLEEGKIVGAAPNWRGTKELWESDPEAKAAKQLVYFFNEETNGVRYSYKWSKARSMIPNKTLYSIGMSRDNKRALSALVKQGKEYLIK